MAKFLKTQGISHYLEELINNAKDKIYLISPYLQINDQLKLLLQDSSSKFTKISVVYGKKEINHKDMDWLDSNNRIKVHYYETLHAKCYVNEREAIITSMNLYMYSQQNNCEMGIYITKENDPQMFDEIIKEAERIVRQSIDVSKNKKVDKVWNNEFHKNSKTKDFKYKSKPELNYGYCIRTGIQIPFNPESPLSFHAFNTWAQFGDANYPEHYCHYSGDESMGETSYNRPILKKYWKQARDEFSF
jgi:phosphatidylserine/phosphatidylglycerophosphate/cardiolipin synthase-like enzyme